MEEKRLLSWHPAALWEKISFIKPPSSTSTRSCLTSNNKLLQRTVRVWRRYRHIQNFLPSSTNSSCPTVPSHFLPTWPHLSRILLLSFLSSLEPVIQGSVVDGERDRALCPGLGRHPPPVDSAEQSQTQTLDPNQERPQLHVCGWTV